MFDSVSEFNMYIWCLYIVGDTMTSAIKANRNIYQLFFAQFVFVFGYNI